jgi:hypothetical protein
MSISNSAAGSTPPATPDSDSDPFMPEEGEEVVEEMEMEGFELLGCYTSLSFSGTVVENGEEAAKGVKVVDPQMNLQLCFEVCRGYGIVRVWNDTCICGAGMGVPSSSESPDPFLPAPTTMSQARILREEEVQTQILEEGLEMGKETEEGGCDLSCPGNTNQICGGGVEAVVRKRERRMEGVRWSVYLNLKLTLLNGDEDGDGGKAAARAKRYRYTDVLARETETGTGNVSSNGNGNATTMGFQSAATRRRRGRGLSLTSLVLVFSAVLLLLL